MVEFLCANGTPFEREGYLTFLDIDDDEIDEHTGCPISGLILELLQEYDVKMDPCQLNSLNSRQQAYAHEKDLV
jgi:hypothetical protein